MLILVVCGGYKKALATRGWLQAEEGIGQSNTKKHVLPVNDTPISYLRNEVDQVNVAQSFPIPSSKENLYLFSYPYSCLWTGFSGEAWRIPTPRACPVSLVHWGREGKAILVSVVHGQVSLKLGWDGGEADVSERVFLSLKKHKKRGSLFTAYTTGHWPRDIIPASGILHLGGQDAKDGRAKMLLKLELKGRIDFHKQQNNEGARSFFLKKVRL